MNESDVESFWNSHPCGDAQVGGLKGKLRDDYCTFFERYDAFRYANEPHILRCLDEIDFAGKKVLEIGLGQGADSQQLIRRGANWTGVDLTAESVERVQMRLSLFDLPHDEVVQGSATNLPFSDDQFDMVFSHGVLHHIPDIELAQREIARDLKPHGTLIAMVYAKRSLNYYLSISIVRRVGLLACYYLGVSPDDMVGKHLENARSLGIWQYLKLKNFIHRNTDGPENPYSKVYDLTTVGQDFPDFELEKSYKCFMHAPPLPVRGLSPLSRWLGWHLWIHLKPRRK